MTNRKELIVVLGMHRSGTSAITRGLQVLGVSLGERLMPAIENINARGFWEDIDLNSLNIEMLQAIGSDWFYLAPINADNVNKLHKDGYFLRAVELLQEKVCDVPIFGFKDPRMAKLLPFWKEVFNHCQLNVKYVLTIRHPLSVVRSLAKRDGFVEEHSYLLWLGHTLESLIGSIGKPRVLVDYDCMMQSPDAELMRVARALNLEIDNEELHNYETKFLDESLRHTKYDYSDLLSDVACPAIVQEVYSTLLDAVSDSVPINDNKLSAKISCWTAEFEQLRSALVLADKLLSQNASVSRDISERDEQIVNLSQTVTERDDQIIDLRKHLDEILGSKSWKLTKPLRHIRRMMTGQKTTFLRQRISTLMRNTWRTLPLTPSAKQRLKTGIFNTAPFLFRHTGAYQDWRDFQSHASSYKKERWGLVIDNAESQYTPLLQAVQPENLPVKVICFYLPQFHSIPENDAWWGEGFTEWTNVQPAQSQFDHHYQPHVPGELGYYNLLDPIIQRRQVELARLYGIGGFCFYFYWFGGKRLLEAPIENYLNDPSLELPFCLCWANENWSRRWDGLENEILIAQRHSPDDDLAFIRHVARYFKDPRYIRINDRPLLIVYRPGLLPSARETATRWRAWCRNEGLGEIYLAYTQSFETVDPKKYDFDAAIEFPPNNSLSPNVTASVTPVHEDFASTVYDWRIFVKRSENYKKPGYKLFRGVCPSWDNTARRRNHGTVFINSTPTLYQRWLENAIQETNRQFCETDEKLIFVNAWNEWAEGAHLEPDTRYGYAWLQATRNALVAQAVLSQHQILIVTHDCHPHGAQFLILEIARQLVRNGYRLAIVALDGGKLQEEFARLGPMLLMSSSDEAALDAFLIGLRNRGCRDAISSTVVSGSILPVLKKFGYRVVSLIHELPGVIRSMKQESNAQHIAQFADKIIFPAKLVRDQFATIASFAAEKALVRPQGLLRKNPYHGKNQQAHREVCKRLELPADTRIVLNIGYLDTRKGADLFVEIAGEVCRLLKDTVFIWVGHTERELEQKVRARIEELGLQKRVLLVGFDPEPLVYYAAASVYALTSREDPFPNVVLESVSVGVPVVAFEGTTGAAEFIVQQGGRLARHLDTNDFSARLEELLDRTAATKSQCLPDLSLQRYILDLLHYLNGTPRVSVIVPNYNYAQLIKSRLDSVCKQAYPVYELIVLDDASTDDSVSCVEKYFRESSYDGQIVLNESNSGSVFRQWAKGLQLVTGDLVWIAEADDIAHPDFLSAMVPAFVEKSTVMAFCQSRQIDEEGRVLSDNYLDYTNDIAVRWQMDHSIDGIDEIRTSMAIKNVIPNVSAVLFDRQSLLKALDAVGKDLFDYRVAGDWLVYLHVLAQGRLYFSTKSLNDHRRHQNSVTSTIALKNHLAEVAKVQSIAHRIARPEESVLAQSKGYLARLREQFGLENFSIDEGRDANHHIA